MATTSERVPQGTDMVTPREAAGLLGVGERTVWKWIARGVLEARHYGREGHGTTLVPRRSLERLQRPRRGRPKGSRTRRPAAPGDAAGAKP